GAHRALGPLRAGAGVGTALVTGLGAAHLRVVLSLEWAPGPPDVEDRDRDGVPDGEDVCPDVPGTSAGPPGAKGCPEAPSDRDRDGMVDRADACPDVPGVRTRDLRTHGCPDRVVLPPEPTHAEPSPLAPDPDRP